MYPRFSNISFHLQKSQLYALIFWFYPLLCKGHLSIFDLCWGDFTTPPSYYIGHLFEIFNHPRWRRGKKTFSTPYRNCCPLSSAGSLVTITGGTLFHRARKQAIKAPPPQSPTRFSITPLISTSNWTHIPLSYCQTPGSMAGRRSCFTKQRRPAVAFHTIVRRRTLCIPTSDQVLCPVGIFRGKAVSKADSAPPMSHPMQQKRPSRRFKNIECTQQNVGERHHV